MTDGLLYLFYSFQGFSMERGIFAVEKELKSEKCYSSPFFFLLPVTSTTERERVDGPNTRQGRGAVQTDSDPQKEVDEGQTLARGEGGSGINRSSVYLSGSWRPPGRSNRTKPPPQGAALSIVKNQTLLLIISSKNEKKNLKVNYTSKKESEKTSHLP